MYLDGGGAVVAELKSVASIAGVGAAALGGATLGSSGLPLDSHVASPADNTKGLKMKIKRKSVNSTGGSQRHEIVSEDDAPHPKSKKAKERDRDRDKDNSSNSSKDSSNSSSGVAGGNSSQLSVSAKELSVLRGGDSSASIDTNVNSSSTNERTAGGGGSQCKDSPSCTTGVSGSKQHSSKLNGNANGQHQTSGPASSQQHQQLQQQQQLLQQNGPSISAPESVFRTNRPEGVKATIATREQGTLCSSVGIVTEPDSLGVCEPGTSVLLEGIVWQETEGGK